MCGVVNSVYRGCVGGVRFGFLKKIKFLPKFDKSMQTNMNPERSSDGDSEYVTFVYKKINLEKIHPMRVFQFLGGCVFYI